MSGTNFLSQPKALSQNLVLEGTTLFIFKCSGDRRILVIAFPHLHLLGLVQFLSAWVKPRSFNSLAMILLNGTVRVESFKL